jgi:hypothetical protein
LQRGGKAPIFELRKVTSGIFRIFPVFSAFDFAGLSYSGKNDRAGRKNLPTTVPVEPGFSQRESHKSPACDTNARLVAEKATERCLQSALLWFMMQVKSNDRGLKQWQHVTF